MTRPARFSLYCIALLLAFFSTAALRAQVAKPLPMKQTPQGGFVIDRGPIVGLELTGGLNLPTVRRFRADQGQLRELSWRPNLGYFVGLNLVLLPEEQTSFSLGLEYVREGGAFSNFVVGDPEDQRSFRKGDIEVVENAIRTTLQLRVRFDHVVFLVGTQISGNIGNSYDYRYVQTANFRFNPETGEPEPLAEPISRSGTEERSFDRGGYVGLLLGVGYPVTPRLTTRLRYDVGVHTALGFGRLDRHIRQRADFGVDYLLFSE